MKAVAEDKARRADKDAKDAAAAYRNLASIAAVSDPGRAREYYALAAHRDPSNVWGMYRNGWFHELAGQLDVAQTAYARVIILAKEGTDDDALVWAIFGLGHIERERGDLGLALASYRKAETIADRLSKSDPGNANWQFDLAASNENVAGVLMAKGNFGEALKLYETKREIISHLMEADPGNPRWQRELSRSHDNIGDTQMTRGHLPEALVSYQASLANRERLANTDPGNT